MSLLVVGFLLVALVGLAFADTPVAPAADTTGETEEAKALAELAAQYEAPDGAEVPLPKEQPSADADAKGDDQVPPDAKPDDDTTARPDADKKTEERPFDDRMLALAGQLGISADQARQFGSPEGLMAEMSARIAQRGQLPKGEEPSAKRELPKFKIDLPTEGEDAYDPRIVEAIQRQLDGITEHFGNKFQAIEDEHQTLTTEQRRSAAAMMESRMDGWLGDKNNPYKEVLSDPATRDAVKTKAKLLGKAYYQDPTSAPLTFEGMLEEAVYLACGPKLKDIARQEQEAALARRRSQGTAPPSASDDKHRMSDEEFAERNDPRNRGWQP